ncbi:MAG: radical SAM protein, partial [Deltaproteobacteria bacterium]|nr:radical SAM protein [Deltaproteobacteria bacterium]
MRTRDAQPFPPMPQAPGGNVRRRFQVMIKPGGAACNLECTYCYYLHKAELFRQPPSARMSDAVLEAVTRQYIEANEHDSLVFSWQGGEPCLLGPDFFAKALRMQEKYNSTGKSVENTLQTNGTLITDEWAAFLKQHKFLVGLSVDGPEYLHDMHRKDKGGRPSFARLMEGHGHLRRHGVSFTVLTTIHRHNAKKP